MQMKNFKKITFLDPRREKQEAYLFGIKKPFALVYADGMGARAIRLERIMTPITLDLIVNLEDLLPEMNVYCPFDEE